MHNKNVVTQALLFPPPLNFTIHKMWKITIAILLVKILSVKSFADPGFLGRHLQLATPSFQRSSTFSQTRVYSSTTETLNDDNVKILGITGGIGSGKSSVCQILTSDEFQKIHGCDVHHIDTDKLAHLVYVPGSKAIEQIRLEFGDGVISKEKIHDSDEEKEKEVITINRKNLGEIVFSDKEAMSVSLLSTN